MSNENEEKFNQLRNEIKGRGIIAAEQAVIENLKKKGLISPTEELSREGVCPTTNKPCDIPTHCKTTCFLTQQMPDNIILSDDSQYGAKVELPCICDSCNKAYDHDLTVPDELWAIISPRKIDGWKSGGLLCPECIMDKTIKFYTGILGKYLIPDETYSNGLSGSEWQEFILYLTGYKKEQLERQVENWKRNVKK